LNIEDLSCVALVQTGKFIDPHRNLLTPPPPMG
jgi:hypothetical protein